MMNVRDAALNSSIAGTSATSRSTPAGSTCLRFKVARFASSEPQATATAKMAADIPTPCP